MPCIRVHLNGGIPFIGYTLIEGYLKSGYTLMKGYLFFRLHFDGGIPLFNGTVVCPLIRCFTVHEMLFVLGIGYTGDIVLIRGFSVHRMSPALMPRTTCTRPISISREVKLY